MYHCVAADYVTSHVTAVAKQRAFPVLCTGVQVHRMQRQAFVVKL
jgi:hypothetical protein